MTSGSGTFSTLEILINVSSEMLTRPRSTSLTYLELRSAFPPAFLTQTGFLAKLADRACPKFDGVKSPQPVTEQEEAVKEPHIC